MNIDGMDLRDALDPLAGDPVRDAAMVLAGMPKPGLPPITWWLLAAGVLVGLGAGPWLFGGDASRTDLPVVVQDKDKPDKPDERKEDEKRKIDIQPIEKEDRIWFYGTDSVTVIHPDKTRHTLKGDHALAMGCSFETGSSLAGMLLEYDVQLRLGSNTIAHVSKPSRISLTQGQLWLYTGETPDGMVVVDTAVAGVDVIGGSANVSLTSGRLTVVCLSGRVEIHPKQGDREPIDLVPDTMGTVSPDGRDGPAKVPFVEPYTTWMTRLLLQQLDSNELEARIAKMVDAYFGREHREAARSELRRIGARCIPAIVERYRRGRNVSPKFARATAEMVGAMAESGTKKWVFDLLYDADPEIRVTAYKSAYRITGVNAGTGDKFWRREDNAKERAKVIGEWWELVR
jgi:FecR protein